MSRPTLDGLKERVREVREFEEVRPALRDALDAAIEHVETQQDYWSQWGVTDDDEHDRRQFDRWCERRGALDWLWRRLGFGPD